MDYEAAAENQTEVSSTGHGLSSIHLAHGQRIAEEDNFWPYRALAMEAFGYLFTGADSVHHRCHGFGPCAGKADTALLTSMEFDHIMGAALLVQSIDVLGHDSEDSIHGLEVGDGSMGWIGLGITERVPDR